jgi:UDP-glucose:(heptosyl)LPS alpha-1,3-glucosyltransferase
LRKGLKVLIQALALLRKTQWAGLSFRLMVAGKGHIRRYERLAIQEGVRSEILFLGPVRDTSALYAAADVFCLPTSYEPFSNACMEALASGLPVVTSHINGASEILEGRSAGAIVENPFDPSEVARVLAPLADASTRQRMGDEARRLAEEHPVDQKVEQTLALYQELLSSRGK